MSDMILTDSDKLERAIVSISNIVTEIEEIKVKLNKADESLRGVWIGKSGDAYFENSNIIINSFNEYINGLYDLINNLSSVKNTFLDTGRSSANSICKEEGR